ncbi:MAG: S9 family peptidase [Gemmatimonadales bacterium]|nr:S9 family peptidase [Gemmatimonadales bacterium]
MTRRTAAPPEIRRPPPTHAMPQVDEYHGVTIADPYRWLEDPDSPETAEWVREQNEVTFDYLRRLPDREPLRRRLTELLDYERYSVPVPRGDRLFFLRNDGLQNQSPLYVQDGLDGTPRLLLDPNRFSHDGTASLSVMVPSPDGRLVAYGTSTSGSDWTELRVRDVASGEDFADHLRWIKFSDAAWTKDGGGFFYARYPAPREGEALVGANRDMKLYYHRLGTPQEADLLVFERPDRPEWGFGAAVTDDGRYLAVTIWQGTDTRTRVHLADLRDAAAPDVGAAVHPLLDDFDAAYHLLGNDGPIFYFQTTRDAPRWRVVAIDSRRPAPAEWREVVSESNAVLQGSALFGGSIVGSYLQDAHSVLRRFGLDGRPLGEIALPGLGSVVGPSGERDDPRMFYSFTSFLYPATVFSFDFASEQSSTFKAPRVDFDPLAYETSQLFCRSKDGTRVPIFLTAMKGLARDGRNRALLYGYGGFNVPLTPAFSATLIPWLERGGLYAVANLRGGGEYGEDWHQAGMFEKKQQVFDDFIAAAEHLIEEGYTTASRLAIEGGSNGGLLVGAVMTQRPELFGVALPAVGVLDMLRYHKFTIGWAWVSEYGSADDPALFPALLAYSPLHNLKPGIDYPATLITTADHDDRVVPAHSFKFAAALQAGTAWKRPAYIRIETKAGHGAGKPVSKIIEERADVIAFTLANLASPVAES